MKKKMRLLHNYEHNMRYYILNGIMFTIMLNLYKPFKVKFLERIGGTEFHISLLNSLPGLVAVFTIIPGTILFTRFKNKRRITSYFFIASRMFLLIFALIPLIPAEMQPMIFVICMALMNFPESISQSSLVSYVGEIFSRDERSTAISNCKRLSIPIQIIVVIITGKILSDIPSNEQQRMLIYQGFFVLAFLIGMLEIWYFLKLQSKVEVVVKKLNFKKTFKKISKDTKFWGFVVCSLTFHFGWQMGWPLFSIYQIDYLGADEMWLGAITISSSITLFIGYKFWNKKIIKYGNSLIVILATSGMAANSFCVAISPNLYYIVLFSLVSGFFTSGTVTVLFNLLLEVTPEDDRVLYVGMYNIILNISLFISPIVGHLLLKNFGMFWALICVSLLRLLGGGTFLVRNLIKSRA